MTTTENIPHRAVSIPAPVWSSFVSWVVCNGGYLQVVDGSPVQARRFVLTQRDPDMVILPVKLTRREFDVLRGIQAGKSNSEIGRGLYLSEDTIKTHVRRLFRKLDVSDRARAVAVGYELGLLGGD